MAADPLLILIICVTDDAPLAFVCMIECVCLMLLVCVCIKPYDSATIDSLCANRDTIIATRPTISIRLNVRRLQINDTLISLSHLTSFDAIAVAFVVVVVIVISFIYFIL